MTNAANAEPAEAGRPLALVTGASSGIGAEFARQLAERRYDLVLVARSRDRLEALAKELAERRGIDVAVLAADLTQDADLSVVAGRVADEERLELLVNNAGMGTVGPFASADADREESEIRLNVLALVRLTHSALPKLIGRGRGAILNVSSLAGLFPAPYNATYGATKAFVNSFTEALYEEVRGTGVSLQALCPGFTRTEFQARAGIDPGEVPAFAWMDPDSVVRSSLEALDRRELICVPGLGYRGLAALTGAIPRGLVRRAAAAMQAKRHRVGDLRGGSGN